jgi:hypothetical protein
MQVEKGAGPEGKRILLGVNSSLTVEVRRGAAVPRLRGDVVLHTYQAGKVKTLSGRK